jgi:hypothetical protein
MNGTVLEHPTLVKRKHCRRLVEVLEKTKSMVEYAQLGNWQEVGRLEVERRDELNECFAYKIADNDSYLISEALATVLHMNEELMSIVARARRELIQKQGDTVQTKSNINEYLDVSGLG